MSDREIKILHVNASDTDGGAAKACIRLHEAMLKEGINSKVLVQRKKSKGENVFRYSKIDEFIFSKIRRKVNSLLARRCKTKSGSFTPIGLGRDITSTQIFKEADVVYFHYINSGFLNTSSVIKALQSGKTIIWFMHDMWPFTGGCHYSFDCTNYLSNCKFCYYLKKPSKNDVSVKLFKKKLELSSFTNLTIVSPSRWLAECAKNSKSFKNLRCLNIPNTLNHTVFNVHSSTSCRKEFSLPEDKKIILFGAIDAVRNPYKGWKYLKDAINLLSYRKEEVQIVVFGSEEDANVSNSLKYNVSFVGYIGNDETLARLYNAVDLFVLPSLADNFPNTLLESLFCGTPCVGFDVGGVKDLIVNNTTGYLAKYKDPKDLSKGIETVLENQDYSRDDIAGYIRNKYCERKIVDIHMDLIDDILK